MGCDEQFLCQLDKSVLLHGDVIKPFQAMCDAAAGAGLRITVASGYRSFSRQLAIWNNKARGLRPVLDDTGSPIDLGSLSDRDRVMAILRWSALPGCSRHHWGTDMDVWDAAAVPDDYRLQLVPGEYAGSGPFCRLAEWLQEHAAGFGFIRPYAIDYGGVAPEPWHLSYRPIAQLFEEKLDAAFLREILDNDQLELRDAVLANLDTIMARFIFPAITSPQ
jgi:LAS superfamily LD-carboxypeptidase LdcB